MYARVFCCFVFFVVVFFQGTGKFAGGSTLDAVVESSCTCPVCQQQALEQTLKKRGGFHTTGLTQAAYFLKTTMTTLLCGAPELLGSTGLAPGLCGLQIISRLSPFTYKLIGLPHVPLFSVPLKFPGCFPTVCFTHRVGIPPWGLLGGYGGVVTGSGRNCQSISFLWPWETAPQDFCIFLASLLGFRARLYTGDDKVYPGPRGLLLFS